MKAEFRKLLYTILFILLQNCYQSSAASNGNFNPTYNPIPKFSHIVVVIGENTNQKSVFGNSNAPFINTLAASGAKFTNSYALFHPSQPNYIALFSGSNQGITNNNYVSTKFTTPNLGSELINAGKTFITYSEDLPSVGFDGASNGLYVRKHNPVTNWMGAGINQIPFTTNQPFTSFPANFFDLPDVAFVIPNLCSDGHDVCPPINHSVRQFDSWIENHLNAYRKWAVNNNSLLIITYDEDEFSLVNKIATIFYGAYVAKGVYTKRIDHYNILRTIEGANRLSTHVGAAANTTPIDYCWTSYNPFQTEYDVPDTNKVGLIKSLLIYPSPADDKISVVSEGISNSKTINWEIILLNGEIKSAGTAYSNSSGTFDIKTNEYKDGIYILRISDGIINRQKKFVIVR